jgi:hypothetical protein
MTIHSLTSGQAPLNYGGENEPTVELRSRAPIPAASARKTPSSSVTNEGTTSPRQLNGLE